MRRLRTSLTPEALIEKIALETLPAGSELVWACTGPGPPRRGLLYRTKKPVPSSVREFKALGRRFKLEVLYNDGQLLVTWSPLAGRLKH